MRRSIFYSWQSDLDNSINRNFIEDVLKRALRGISKDGSESIEPVLDRDTAGLSGSPSISESIFAKIIQSNLFVADISIINPETGARPTPNPNVLVELGYAIAQLGWDRILLIQNTAFGGPESLPFDLRGRRVVTYNLSKIIADRAEIKGLLQGRLEAGLKTALSASVDISKHAISPLWWGKWNIEGNGIAHYGQLFVREVGPAGFLFDISVSNGSHSGTLSGYARLVSADLAYYRIHNGEFGGICELVFRRSLSQNRRIIEVEETGSCSWYRGMGVTFTGAFVRNHEVLFDCGFLDELDLIRLYSITGSFYESLSLRFQTISENDSSDAFKATVIVGALPGLFTIMEAIAMRGESGELWAAYIDDDVVRYFTTECDFKQRLPVTIENWRERFKEKEVIYHSCVDVIPKQDR